MLNDRRRLLIEEGLAELEAQNLLTLEGKNGDALAHDEAAVWKRVLNFRIARFLQPRCVLETHPGLGISTWLYSKANSESCLLSKDIGSGEPIDLVDIDPFGQPWDTIQTHLDSIMSSRCTMISNGEAFAVRRNLKRAQRYPTLNFGRRLPRWVIDELIPRLESITDKRCVFFYAFPTTVRVILSNEQFPPSTWAGCPQWMWWLEKNVWRGRYT